MLFRAVLGFIQGCFQVCLGLFHGWFRVGLGVWDSFIFLRLVEVLTARNIANSGDMLQKVRLAKTHT
jgi:hypothetical protein